MRVMREFAAKGSEKAVSPHYFDNSRMIIWRVIGFVGSEFIDENGGGPGVRLRKRQRAKQSK